MSLNNSDEFRPKLCAKRSKSSFTTSGTLPLISDVPLPIEAGNPIERANAAWAAGAVSSMLCNVVDSIDWEYRRRSEELRGLIRLDDA